MPEAKVRGYKPGRFSFNKPGGRCEACEGNGSNRLEMDFLADVWVTCPVCEGRRFNRETLQIRFKGKNIHDVLEMDVQEALEHFAERAAHPRHAANAARRRPRLHQARPAVADAVRRRGPAHQAGHANCAAAAPGETLYILDEPTTGLHFDDIQQAAAGAARLRRRGQHGRRHRAQPRRHQDGRLAHRPRPRRRRGRRRSRLRRHAGRSRRQRATRTPARRCSRSAQRRRPRTRKRGQGEEAAKSKPARPSTRWTRSRSRGRSSTTSRTSTVELPRERMTVCCGPSGSGKSSLALDTIYAEGQRRYIESLSAYARQFLGQMQKPKVEHVSGLSPAISIEQKTTSKSPRSTVGTVTEIYDYLRILYARLGQPYCPACGIPIGTQTADEIIDKILALPEGTKLYLMAPLERRGQEKYETLWDEIRRTGFVRMRVDGKSYNVEEPPAIDHRRKHLIEVVVDRVDRPGQPADAHRRRRGSGARPGPRRDARRPRGRQEARSRTGRSIASASTSPATAAAAASSRSTRIISRSTARSAGAPRCEGLGVQQGANPALLIRDPRQSLRDGALAAWPDLTRRRLVPALRRGAGAPRRLSRSIRRSSNWKPAQQQCVLHGTGEAWIPLDAIAAKSDEATGRASGRPSASSTRACCPPSTRRRASARLSPAARSPGQRSPLLRLRRLAAARRCRGLPFPFGSDRRP